MNIFHCIYLTKEGEVPLQSPLIPFVAITARAVPSTTEEWELEIGRSRAKNMLQQCGKFPYVGSKPSPCCIRVLRRSTCIQHISKDIWEQRSTNRVGGISLSPTLTMRLRKLSPSMFSRSHFTHLRAVVAQHCPYIYVFRDGIREAETTNVISNHHRHGQNSTPSSLKKPSRLSSLLYNTTSSWFP